ncbi:MAG: hypothetical protein M5U26_24105 [Planctomycetota bacterium]|nr:hypothetical protein [Planctomycetota bacterium]
MSKCKPVLILFLGLSACALAWGADAGPEGRRAPAGEPVPAYEQPGPFDVRVREFPDLKDAKRAGRRVPLKAVYPTGEKATGPFPLAIFSHGGAGNYDANIEQAKHLASHGYVVVAPQHVDSDTDRVRHYMSPGGGRMKFWDALNQITIDAPASLERPRDVSFAIDRALEWNRDDAELKGKIDPEKIGMAGHSYGAYTTLVACGAVPMPDHLVPRPKPEDCRGLADARIKAGVAMSPQGKGGVWFDETSFKEMRVPMLLLTGSKDQLKGPKGEILPPENRRLAFDAMAPGEKHLAWLANVDHMAFSHNPAARQLFPSPALEDGQRIAKALTAAFFEAYLKNDARARGCLGAEYANSLAGKVVDKVEWSRK